MLEAVFNVPNVHISAFLKIFKTCTFPVLNTNDYATALYVLIFLTIPFKDFF